MKGSKTVRTVLQKWTSLFMIAGFVSLFFLSTFAEGLLHSKFLSQIFIIAGTEAIIICVVLMISMMAFVDSFEFMRRSAISELNFYQARLKKLYDLRGLTGEALESEIVMNLRLVFDRQHFKATFIKNLMDINEVSAYLDREIAEAEKKLAEIQLPEKSPTYLFLERILRISPGMEVTHGV